MTSTPITPAAGAGRPEGTRQSPPAVSLRGFGLLAVYGPDATLALTRHVSRLCAVRGPDGRWAIPLDPDLGAELDALAAGHDPAAD